MITLTYIYKPRDTSLEKLLKYKKELKNGMILNKNGLETPLREIPKKGKFLIS